ECDAEVSAIVQCNAGQIGMLRLEGLHEAAHEASIAVRRNLPPLPRYQRTHLANLEQRAMRREHRRSAELRKLIEKLERREHELNRERQAGKPKTKRRRGPL